MKETCEKNSLNQCIETFVGVTKISCHSKRISSVESGNLIMLNVEVLVSRKSLKSIFVVVETVTVKESSKAQFELHVFESTKV